MPVELRAVDAGELRFLAHLHATAATHARAVDHDRIEAHDGLDAVWARGFGDAPHHDAGTDRRDLVDLFPTFYQLFDGIRDETLDAIRAVVRRDQNLVGNRAHTIFKNEDVLRLRAENRDNLVAKLVRRTRDRIDRCDADAAANEDNGAHVVGKNRRLPQRADDVEDGIALLERCENLARRANDLEEDRDRPLLAVKIGDRQRYTLTFLVDAQDDELPRQSLLRHTGRLDIVLKDAGRQLLLL